ncbi:HAMP domain-containing methyl-accepting chemotaxis protein [Fluviispira sanaruensis]|uniref:Chemotaxis protein n=1 Tax=Fluviispira sanaruensis TaxID=2493639 RepID=A0A4P2VJC7_FLUSA|nr:methyl-accepting chemotaxis protein [Fluviispira sanaruensis]BBH52598.1 chemotaxis protein [Fluviispira sanaruensis]
MNRKSLAYKLYTSVIIILIIVLISAIYTVLMINKTQGYAAETKSFWLPSIRIAHEYLDNLTLLRQSTLRIMIAQNEQNRKLFIDKWKKESEHIEELGKEYQEYITSEKERESYAKLQEDWKKYKGLNLKIVDLGKQGKTKEALTLIRETTDELIERMEVTLNNLIEINYKGAVQSTKLGANLTSITTLTMIAIISATALIALIIIIIIKTSMGSVSNAIENLKIQSVSTNKIAVTLKKSSNSLSSSITEQAASIHETSAAINEITSMVNRTTENATQSTIVAKAASEKAEEGQATMKRLVKAMDTIQESNVQLQNITGIIGQIHTKTAVINDIVAKTELLSLNASIESARAGEYGKGFAVVAEEVGTLAKMSGQSASEIQDLINKSLEQVNQILEVTKGRVAEGKKVTTEAKESFLQISDDIANMTNVIHQISDATREQEIGVRQIATAMTQIDKATQNSQAASTGAAESSTKLVEQSDSLDITAKDIELLVKGAVT